MKSRRVNFAFWTASRKNGYLIIGAHDNGALSGLKVNDALLKKISGIRSDGNILPLPVMSEERFEFTEGDLLVVEVTNFIHIPSHPDYGNKPVISEQGLQLDNSEKNSEKITLGSEKSCSSSEKKEMLQNLNTIQMILS